jgi:hypothetical protein
MTLAEVAQDLSDRLIAIWLPGPNGWRPVYGGVELFQSDPAWRDNLLFFEYFNGDDGADLGAMHQTGVDGARGRSHHGSSGALYGHELIIRDGTT